MLLVQDHKKEFVSKVVALSFNARIAGLQSAGLQGAVTGSNS